jgi:hypothetical protein
MRKLWDRMVEWIGGDEVLEQVVDDQGRNRTMIRAAPDTKVGVNPSDFNNVRNHGVPPVLMPPSARPASRSVVPGSTMMKNYQLVKTGTNTPVEVHGTIVGPGIGGFNPGDRILVNGEPYEVTAALGDGHGVHTIEVRGFLSKDTDFGGVKVEALVEHDGAITGEPELVDAGTIDEEAGWDR